MWILLERERGLPRGDKERFVTRKKILKSFVKRSITQLLRADGVKKKKLNCRHLKKIPKP